MTEHGEQPQAPSAGTTEELLSRLLLSREQVAELLGVPPATVDNLHRTRQLPAVQVGKYNRWKPEAVRRFVEQLEVAE